jgi:hypothetical protein
LTSFFYGDAQIDKAIAGPFHKNVTCTIQSHAKRNRCVPLVYHLLAFAARLPEIHKLRAYTSNGEHSAEYAGGKPGHFRCH